MEAIQRKKRKAVIAMRVVTAFFFGVLILIVVLAAAFIVADQAFLKGSLSFFVINKLINHKLGQVIMRIGTALFFSSKTWVNILVTSIAAAVLIAGLVLTNILVIDRLKRERFVKAVVQTACHLAVYFFLSLCVASLSLSAVYTGYARRVVNNYMTSLDNIDIRDFGKIQKAIKESKQIAQSAVNVILLELDEEPDVLDLIDEGYYMEIAETLAICFQIKGTVNSAKEHYLRNYFYRAPATLDDMLEAIKNKSSFGWKLLGQDLTVYHMQGHDGAYNLKFVSFDGYHEAVYNRQGVLLTEKNDPVNMGTFNYGDPVGMPAMHAALDVLPYYKYGNCPASPASSKENYDYKNNQDAKNRWADLNNRINSFA